MEPTQGTARLAGALYLVAGLPAVFSYQYVPARLFVSGDATATAHNLLASETLFRAGIASELFSTVAFLFLGRAVHRLLERVDERRASLLLTFVLASIPVSFLNAASDLAALMLARGPEFLSAFDERQRAALAMVFLRLHGQGLVLAQIFWGLWLFPFGVLVMRSGFFPRILGVLLIAAGFGYVATSLTSIVLPSYLGVVSRVMIVLGGLGEGTMMLWLLIKGVKVPPPASPAT
jgi:uncharacterized protein DUF4386